MICVTCECTLHTGHVIHTGVMYVSKIYVYVIQVLYYERHALQKMHPSQYDNYNVK